MMRIPILPGPVQCGNPLNRAPVQRIGVNAHVAGFDHRCAPLLTQ
jgi:hypothetical protein